MSINIVNGEFFIASPYRSTAEPIKLCIVTAPGSTGCLYYSSSADYFLMTPGSASKK